ncbi:MULTISPECIES: helix-turn-helix domain-containing protein [Acinetobacter]|uniref:helix-turn-helix domain-containing protein n=1 Tax=Acinetobacter TaxID=469 RepID=UPI000F825151
MYKLNDHQLESYVHDEWDRADQSFETIDKICIALNGEVGDLLVFKNMNENHVVE